MVFGAETCDVYRQRYLELARGSWRASGSRAVAGLPRRTVPVPRPDPTSLIRGLYPRRQARLTAGDPSHECGRTRAEGGLTGQCTRRTARCL